MASRELFHQGLPVESDLLDFAGHVLDAVERLGGSRLQAATVLLEVMAALRQAGAGSGYPLVARLLLNHTTLLVRWGEEIAPMPVGQLRGPPSVMQVEQLAHELRLATAVTDATRLLQRNQAMTRHLEETRRQTERELSQLQTVLAERQAELRETLRQAETDALTGLFNRRAFDDRMERAFRRAQRQRSEHLSLLMLDLDYFKEINDLHGHQYGDEYLVRMADALRGSIRADVDMAFRFGGDEFVVLMFADVHTACRKAMQVLHEMEGKVSVGISSLPVGEAYQGDLRDFIRSADEALYQAKRAGRGRVVVDVCRHCDDGCIVHCRDAGVVAPVAGVAEAVCRG